MSEFSHFSVLLSECIENLNIKPDGIYVDGTAGGAGHSSKIAERLDGGLLIPIDQDEDAIKVISERLAPYGERVKIVRDNFSNIKSVLEGLGIEKIDGLLLDLGVSSYQLDTAERGFSYMADAPLDMRMDNRAVRSAYTVINEYSADELKRIIYDFGEERFAPKIAYGIVNAREKAPVKTTGELVEIIKNSLPSFARREEWSSVKRVFQAVRIEVNRELDVIAPTIEAAVNMMNEGGRIVIITFHSLEDRIVKQTFQSLASGCTCPKDFPVCVCGNKPKIKILTKKPILPSDAELAVNSRSKSAKLRVAEKI
ncbi:MAG: 16S rRNA (cytosine(1402)-N(4))-methyltransferase RsmH [Clostridia bacterium]|nr:16S rRNA (cytosine(1402)-N(4))-methyltransferase RsmH [Clostridia bacterium]